MKIFASLLLLLFSLPSFSQIKVVGADYKESLTASAKAPAEIISLFKEYDGLSVDATLYNCVGDTVYIADKKYAWLVINHECKMIYDGGEVTPGYYVITGIIIGNDEVEKINEKVIELQSLGFTGEHNPYTGGYSNSREFLDEYFSKYKSEKLQYVFTFKLQQVGTENESYVKYDLMRNNVIPVRYFNFVSKKLLNRKVYADYKYGNEAIDAITGQEIIPKDDYFFCKDIVVGKNSQNGNANYKIIAIVEGKNTGAFALEIGDWDDKKQAFNLYAGNYELLFNESDYNNRAKTLANQEALKKAEKKKKEANIIAKYGERYGRLILSRKVDIGMTKEMCKLAVGSPLNTIRSKDTNGITDIWIYSNTSYLRFINNKLVEFMK